MKVLLIDSHNLIHRARFGFGDGKHKIYFNFFRMLFGELKNHKPDIVYIVDEGRATQSKELLESYKGNRIKITDPDFFREKDEIFDTIKNISGFVHIRHPHRECDDVIGELSKTVHKNDDVVIVSTDSDFIQLITDNIKLWHPKQKSFVEKWPVDYVTWKSLRGDPTDNVPGVRGIGDKRATDLTSNPAALSSFLSSSKEISDQFEMCKKIIELKTVPLQDLQVTQCDFNHESLFEQFELRNFKSMIGNSWKNWKMMFESCGGKNAFK